MAKLKGCRDSRHPLHWSKLKPQPRFGAPVCFKTTIAIREFAPSERGRNLSGVYGDDCMKRTLMLTRQIADSGQIDDGREQFLATTFSANLRP